jgi:hypothetical protein
MIMNFILHQFHIFAAPCSESSFFGLPAWYHYLNVANKMQSVNGQCDFIAYGANGKGGFQIQDLSLIGLGVLDILLRLAAMITIGYIIYGGFTYITSQGEPAGVKRAQSTIFNALIGLGISLAAIGGVTFIGSSIAG